LDRMWQTRLQLVLLALLMFSLLFLEWRRVRPEEARTARAQATFIMALARSWTRERWRRWKTRNQQIRASEPLEVAELKRRILHLRDDYLAAPRARPLRSSRREQVAASIRQTFHRLAYFRGEQMDNSEVLTHEHPAGHK
jgi:hypothetical protein